MKIYGFHVKILEMYGFHVKMFENVRISCKNVRILLKNV